jgi:hypothetical protein
VKALLAAGVRDFSDFRRWQIVLAAVGGHVDILRLLLAESPEPWEQGALSLALFWAICYGRRECVVVLVRAGAVIRVTRGTLKWTKANVGWVGRMDRAAMIRLASLFADGSVRAFLSGQSERNLCAGIRGLVVGSAPFPVLRQYIRRFPDLLLDYIFDKERPRFWEGLAAIPIPNRPRGAEWSEDNERLAIVIRTARALVGHGTTADEKGKAA